ncbi:class I SAM-dependent methyltransferase [Formosa sp. S-31]|uniref:class I SAM-dependent methyltransferase n=1 Tax=Formosa sp. S-31 TaxID=2790949 RepID=UPI003EBA5556
MPQKSQAIYISCKDHSVSGEQFDLIYNKESDILITTPQPEVGELGKYYLSEDYISHTDAKRNLFEKVYHLVKQNALKNKLRLINDFASEEKKLLDVGCGTGDFLVEAKKQNWNVWGVEPDTGARSLASEKLGKQIFNVASENTLQSESFDVITLWHVLEHLPDLEEQLKLYNALLKPNGYLVVAVPNFKSYDAKYYKSFWAAYDVPRHLWHFSQNGVKRLLVKTNFSFEKTLPMFFDSFYVSLLSEKYKSGVMNVFNAFKVGLVSNIKARRTGEYSSLIYIAKKK